MARLSAVPRGTEITVCNIYGVPQIMPEAQAFICVDELPIFIQSDSLSDSIVIPNSSILLIRISLSDLL